MTKDKLELDLLLTKVEVIQGITNCTSHKQLEIYIHHVNQVFIETTFLKKNRAERKEIKNTKILREH